MSSAGRTRTAAFAAAAHASRRMPVLGRALAKALSTLPAAAGAGVATLRQPDGVVMSARVDDETQRRILLGIFERRERAAVERLLAPGDTMIDVGAHIGYFSVIGARRVGPGGRVWAFEAFPPNAELLRRNLAANALGHVTVREVAVSDGGGVVQVGRQAGSDSGSVTAGPLALDGCVQVPCARLDDCVPHEPVALLKIDVEGFELRVLRGAAETLEVTEHVLVELNRSALRANDASPEDVLSALSHAGFRHRHVISYDRRRPPAGRLPEFCNLLASRGRPG